MPQEQTIPTQAKGKTVFLPRRGPIVPGVGCFGGNILLLLLLGPIVPNCRGHGLERPRGLHYSGRVKPTPGAVRLDGAGPAACQATRPDLTDAEARFD